MINAILHTFPAQGAPLYAVCDPDDLLADEDLLTTLYARGYALISAADPVALRYQLQQSEDKRDDRSLIVVTRAPVAQLPYDVWQQAERVSLSLTRFFPNLAYPVLQCLTADQRARLAQVPAPSRLLGYQHSIDYILASVFAAEPERWQDPAVFLNWLDAFHSGPGDPLPDPFVARLAQRLSAMPLYAPWPVAALLASPTRFHNFLDGQWRTYLARQTGQRLGETAPAYLLSFENNPRLQDDLPRYLRSGSLQRVELSDPERLPGWARAGVFGASEDVAARRAAELLELLVLQTEELAAASWAQWQLVARTWAEYGTLINARPDADTTAYERWQTELDVTFLRWLQQRYAPLAGRTLPVPHHLFHVPEYLAAQRSQHKQRPLALIILDGLALADWLLIRAQWAAHHPAWAFDEALLLAQIPSITPISRQALVRGERPALFADRLADNGQEGSGWSTFWARKQVPAAATLYARLRLSSDDVPPALTSSRLQVACLVNNSIDDISHGTSMGTAEFLAGLRVWLSQRSPHLEQVIAGLLGRGFLVYITSDHGHVQAQGMGNPREGQVAETRGMRARVYRERALAVEVQNDFPDTVLWADDGLLPDDAFVLMPRLRQAFIGEDDTVVTHGGLTLDEMVVPLVAISESS